jgi:hypothetical protein
MTEYVSIYHKEGGMLFLSYNSREFYMNPAVIVKPIPLVMFHHNNPDTGALDETISVFLRKQEDYALVRISESTAFQPDKPQMTTSAMDDVVLKLDDIAKALFQEIANMPRNSAASFTPKIPPIIS